MIKIFESNGKVDYNKYKRMINSIVSDIMQGSNADVYKNIKGVFDKYNGEVYIQKVSSTYLKYDGKIHSSTKRNNSWIGDYSIQGSISLSNLKQDAVMLAEDIAYVYYLNDGGKEIGTTEFLKLVY